MKVLEPQIPATTHFDWRLGLADAAELAARCATIAKPLVMAISETAPRFCARQTDYGCPNEPWLQRRQPRLLFSVSQDEEFVRIHMVWGRIAFDLGSRCHNYLLLTLARRRLGDKRAGLSEAASGWIDRDELARDLGMTPQRLNVDIHRIRKQFASVCGNDAAAIVERRTGVGQIRIGTGLLSMTRV